MSSGSSGVIGADSLNSQLTAAVKKSVEKGPDPHVMHNINKKTSFTVLLSPCKNSQTLGDPPSEVQLIQFYEMKRQQCYTAPEFEAELPLCGLCSGMRRRCRCLGHQHNYLSFTTLLTT